MTMFVMAAPSTWLTPGLALSLAMKSGLRRVAGLLPGAVALEGLRDHDLEVEAAAAPCACSSARVMTPESRRPSRRLRRESTPSSTDERNNNTPRDRTVHRHAVDLLELGQVLVQHLGAGLERLCVRSSPCRPRTCSRHLLERHTPVVERPRVVRACARVGDAWRRGAAINVRTLAPRGQTPWLHWPSGTPCCTTVARWCTDGAKAPALASSAMQGRLCTWCKLLVLCK